MASDSPEKLLKKTDDFVDHLMVETRRLMTTDGHQEVHELHGVKEPAPSRLAPEYVKELVRNPLLNDEDSSSSFDPFSSENSRSFEELQMFRRRIKDDDRLSNIYQLRHNFSSRFDNRAWVHPHGTTNFDYKAIPKRKQVQVERYKNRVRRENYMYLSRHPEIQAMISLFMKKLLVAQPPDATEYLAEYFATRLKGLKDSKDFELQIQQEMKKLSGYHVQKMKAQGKINIRPSTAVRSEASGEEWLPESDANWMKKLGIEAMAADFSFDPCCLMATKKKMVEGESWQKKLRRRKKKREYCGCKDYKLKKNQQQRQEDGRNTAATLGNVDTLQTDEEGDTEEEDEEGEPEEGEWVGTLGEDGEEIEEEMTPEDADRIASEMVHELFLDPEGAVYSGHHRSLGGETKNIQ